jgi:hypothetical protein
MELKGSFNIKATGPHSTTEVRDSSGVITACIKKKLVTVGAPNQGETLAWVNKDFSSFSNISHGACVIHVVNDDFDRVLLFALCVAVEGVR